MFFNYYMHTVCTLYTVQHITFVQRISHLNVTVLKWRQKAENIGQISLQDA
jgi:hypothetical protein